MYSEGNLSLIHIFYSSLPLDAIVERREITLEKDEFLLLSYNEKAIPIDIEREKIEYCRTLVLSLLHIFPRLPAATTRALLSVRRKGGLFRPHSFRKARAGGGSPHRKRRTTRKRNGTVIRMKRRSRIFAA